MKDCRKCGESKPLDDFVRDRQRKDGRYPYCKPCHRAVVKGYTVRESEAIKQRRQVQQEKRMANVEVREKYLLGRWVYSLKRRYGITASDYIALAQAQHDRCAICGLRFADVERQKSDQTQRLHVDHDHETGKVRGLLCFRCNNGLGFFRDDIAALEAAIAYIKRSRGIFGEDPMPLSEWLEQFEPPGGEVR